MSFPGYHRYKDSGIEWLGRVPEHWGAVPIKHVGRLKGGAGFPHDSQGVEGAELSFHKVNALAQADSQGTLQPSDNTITRETAKSLGAFIFPPQTIVFAKVGAALLLGRIRVLRHNACIDNNMIGLVVHADAYHVGYVMYAMSLVRFDLIANPGAVPSLNEGQIGDFQLAFPPIPEQTAIAEFLDRETAKIDELVTEQWRLMQLLKEKRQAIISHAVTRGLNPAAPLKPSGIEWVGEAPAHWARTRIKHVARPSGNSFIDGDWIETPYITSEGVRLLQCGNVGTGVYVEQGFRYVSQDTFESFGCTEVEPNDVLICRLQSSRTILAGRACLAPQLGMKMITSVDNCILKPSSDFDSRYIVFQLSTASYLSFVEVVARGGTRDRISRSMLGEIEIIAPPLVEQREIAEFLECETARFDALTTEAQRAIDLLQERRTALISAAVTGQIDVRPIAAPLPAEPLTPPIHELSRSLA